MPLPTRAQSRPLALAVSFAFGASAQAATIIVTHGGDLGTANTCNLRQAITSANLDAAGTSNCVSGSGADTITFAAALANSTITLAGSQLDVTAPLTIDGSGQTIDANLASRVMYVQYSALTASKLNFTYGDAGTGLGGGIAVVGGTLALSAATISASKAGAGAGIYAVNLSTVSLTDSAVSANTATTGGGLDIRAGSSLALTDSIVSGNVSQRGGGVFVSQGGTIAIKRSTISYNTVVSSGPSGAGAYGDQCTIMTVIDSTIADNTSNHQGAGMLVYNCPLTMVNVTVSENTALDAAGGGIYVEFGSAALVNSTISGNSAHDSGGLRVYQATVTLDNTIASANIATNAASVATRDLGQGPFASVAAHYSLLGSALNVAPFNAGANHNVFSNSPGLGNLQDNGGPTRTMALASNSPAVDAGSKALALSAGKPLNYDQRTLPWLRLFDDKVDIGAFEYQGDRIFAAIFEPLP